MPTRVPATTISSTVATTALDSRAGPNQRAATASAPSTARTKTGRASVDSTNQLTNGAWVRSMEPTAPRSAITQNPSAKASTTASGTTVDQGTTLSRPRTVPGGSVVALIERVDMVKL